jgi:U3 small nucleolar ribonucleoprotein protein LCP5
MAVDANCMFKLGPTTIYTLSHLAIDLLAESRREFRILLHFGFFRSRRQSSSLDDRQRTTNLVQRATNCLVSTRIVDHDPTRAKQEPQIEKTERIVGDCAMTMTETSGNSTSSGNDGAGADASSSAGPALVLLNEAIRKVRHEVVPRIEGHASGHAAASELDFLKVKNETMITYLIELVAHLRREALLVSAGSSRRSSDDDDSRPNDDDDGNGNGLMRLMEIKTAIDKTRNLEQKLRYQIDKLLVAADSHEQQGERSSGDHGGTGSFAVRNSSSNVGIASATNDDPLEYRPNVGALLGEDDDEEDDNEGEESGDDRDDDQQESSSDDEGEDDEEIAAARRTLALAGKDSKAGQSRQGKDTRRDTDRRHGTGAKGSRDSGEEEAAQPPQQQLYRAPRLASVPYAGDVVDRQAEKAKRERQRLRAGEIATALRSRYTDAPDVEDLHGGAELGRQRETSRKWAQKQQEKTQYEESNMVRLTETRKDKKFKKRLMRQEMSNLSAIADLGSLVVRGLGNGSGGGAGSDDDGDGGRGRRNKARQGGSNEDRDDGHRFSNGKRRRSEDGSGSSSGFGGSNKNKKDRGSSGFQSSNALQAALYGGGRDGGGKKKKRGGKR